MFSAIILAGGAGARTLRRIPKQFLNIAGKPMIMYSLERLDRLAAIREVVVVCHPEHRETLASDIRAYRLKNEYVIIDGGDTRQESTRLGLAAAREDRVIIHEAARPFVSAAEFQALIDHPSDNAIYGSPIPFTVSLTKDGRIAGLLERGDLVNVQLPQKFLRRSMLDAHNRAAAESRQFTEDASVLFHYSGAAIEVIPGTQHNLKITDPVDLQLGEIIYREYFAGRLET